MGRNHGHGGGNRIVKAGNVVYGADSEVARWVARFIPGYHHMPGAKSLGVVKNGKMVAGVVFERFNGAHVEASIAARPSASWADRRTLFHLFAYPFWQLGVEAITVLVAQTNPVSLNLASKLGFEPIAIVPFAAQDGSALIILQMTRNQCRWLKHGQQGRQSTGTT